MGQIFLHGEMVSPMGMIDALDLVEEHLGPDIRQYLESCLMDNGINNDWDESEVLADQKEHYLAVLDNIDVEAAALEQQLSSERINRKRMLECIQSIRSIVEREDRK